MSKALKAELYKIGHIASVKKFLIIAIAINAIIPFVPIIGDASGKTVLSHIYSASSFVSLIITIMVVSVTTHDYTNNTIKNTVCAGISYKDIYISRLISIFILITVTLILSTISVAIGAFIKLGTAGNITISNSFSVVESFFLQLIVLFIYACITHFIASLFRSVFLSLTISAAISSLSGFAFVMLKSSLGIDIESFSLTIISQEISKNDLTGSLFLHLAIVAIIVAVVFALLGSVIFKKRSIY